MKVKHTPGPWYALNEDGAVNTVFKDIKDRRFVIAQVNNWSEETEPNARLISAAPELYTLLDRINMAFYTRTSRKEWLALMAETKPLLQKARGENE